MCVHRSKSGGWVANLSAQEQIQFPSLALQGSLGG